VSVPQDKSWSRGRSAGIINHASWMASFRRVRRIWKELTVTDQIKVRGVTAFD